ncbi:alkene reductase [Paludisphaera soli]|uniref:alkene reductase n=1 Tax=Paludisphaera soli TaxID=2712865 RepID=UPI0013EE21F7|nr:alkene reductase [Paludisphaera soli]
MTETDTLFRPLTIGEIEAPNRIFMAPLTRARATNRVPNSLMVEYYRQRASAGLIITEATAISEEGYGWLGAPGAYDDDQMEGWKHVTGAVHDAGGRIFLQLWHMGRVSHPDFLRGGLPVAPSPIAAEGHAHTPTGNKPYVVPRELTVADVARIVDDYAAAARRAREAGFDGVEVHGANGYLIDQFLRDSSNVRTDAYGGSVENRSRFLVEVVDAVTAAWSAGRTGVRLSPTMNEKAMSDRDPIGLFTHVARALNRFGLAYLHTAEAIGPGRLFNPDAPRVTPHIREAFDGVLVTNGGYGKAEAEKAVRDGEADAIAFGQKFLANPDLPARLRLDAALNPGDPKTYYTHGPEGYIDYPTLGAATAPTLREAAG